MNQKHYAIKTQVLLTAESDEEAFEKLSNVLNQSRTILDSRERNMKFDVNVMEEGNNFEVRNADECQICRQKATKEEREALKIEHEEAINNIMSQSINGVVDALKNLDRVVNPQTVADKLLVDIAETLYDNPTDYDTILNMLEKLTEELIEEDKKADLDEDGSFEKLRRLERVINKRIKGTRFYYDSKYGWSYDKIK